MLNDNMVKNLVTDSNFDYGLPENYNFMIWSDPASIPFPEEVKELINSLKINWDNYYWNSIGLPENGATYSLLGKDLYKELDASGESDVKKEDFSGETSFGSYFVNPDLENGTNFLLTFKAIFVSGKLIEVLLENIKKQPTKDYVLAVENYKQTFKKYTDRQKKWWFKYLYNPYRAIIRSIGFFFVWLLMFLRNCIVKIVDKMTPY